MNYKLNNILLFVTGAACGALVAWKVVKDKYERLIDDIVYEYDDKINNIMTLIQSGEDVTVNDLVNLGCEVSIEESYQEQEEEHNALIDMRAVYHNLVQNEQYAEEVEPVKNIYVIEEDEMGELDGYNQESLNYYADGVLTDQYDNIIDNPEEIIGDIRPLDHFDEGGVDTVCVRNDITKCDYEILRDTNNFDDVYPSKM